MTTPFDFTGKAVLITGGASGLGLATARAFAGGGARVAVLDLDEVAARQAAADLGEAHLGLAGDVSREADIDRVIAAVMARFGRIDVLVNSAGIGEPATPTLEQSPEAWQRLLDVHLTGAWLACRAVARVMIAQGEGGAIVNLNSIGGVIGLPRRTGYSAAKAGIGMLTRVLGCEWAAHHIRVNAVAPGYIATPMTRALIDAGRIDPARIQRRTPMGQFGTPEHIADAITFLASPQAAFITGVTLPVDGGYMAFGAPDDAFTGEG